MEKEDLHLKNYSCIFFCIVIW